MADLEALFEAVLAQPDEDEPRLVYADWLCDHAQPERAEFIRTQIERVKEGDPHRRLELRALEHLLLYGRHLSWQPGSVPGVKWGDFGRGFVDSASIDAAKALPHLDKLFHLAPISALRVDLDGCLPAEVEVLFAWSGLERLRALSFTRGPDTTLGRLLDCRRLSKLERLTLISVPVTADQLSQALGHLSALRDLSVQSTQLQPADWSRLRQEREDVQMYFYR